MKTQCKQAIGDTLAAYSSGRNGTDLKHTALVTHERAGAVQSEVVIIQQAEWGGGGR